MLDQRRRRDADAAVCGAKVDVWIADGLTDGEGRETAMCCRARGHDGDHWDSRIRICWSDVEVKR